MAPQLGGNRSHRTREVRRQERRARKAIDSAILAVLRACPDGLDAPVIAARVSGQPGVHVAQGAVLQRLEALEGKGRVSRSGGGCYRLA